MYKYQLMNFDTCEENHIDETETEREVEEKVMQKQYFKFQEYITGRARYLGKAEWSVRFELLYYLARGMNNTIYDFLKSIWAEEPCKIKCCGNREDVYEAVFEETKMQQRMLRSLASNLNEVLPSESPCDVRDKDLLQGALLVNYAVMQRLSNLLIIKPFAELYKSFESFTSEIVDLIQNIISDTMNGIRRSVNQTRNSFPSFINDLPRSSQFS